MRHNKPPGDNKRIFITKKNRYYNITCTMYKTNDRVTFSLKNLTMGLEPAIHFSSVRIISIALTHYAIKFNIQIQLLYLFYFRFSL